MPKWIIRRSVNRNVSHPKLCANSKKSDFSNQYFFWFLGPHGRAAPRMMQLPEPMPKGGGGYGMQCSQRPVLTVGWCHTSPWGGD